jgi:hypothetical protein
MPFMQAFVERLNVRFSSASIDNVDATLLDPTGNVADAAVGSTRGSGAINATSQERDYVMNNYSRADLDALRDVLHWAVTQNPRVPVQFLWVPGPNFQMEFFNVAGTPASNTAPASRGGISVLLRGPTSAQVIRQYP